MRQIHVIEELGSYMLEPDEVPEIERDFNLICSLEVDGTNENYYKLTEKFDEKWDKWKIVPLSE